MMRQQPVSLVSSPLPRRDWPAWLMVLGLCVLCLAAALLLDPAPERPLLQRGLTAWLISGEEPTSLVRGLWPAGYPMLLRGVSEIVGDGLLAARLLAAAAFGFLLVGVYRLVLALTKRRGLARATLPFVALFAPLAGTALTASPGLIYGALALWSVYAAVTSRGRKLGLFVSGLFAGLAYLFRYQALALLLFGLLAAVRLHRRNWLAELGLFLGGFFTGALPQLLLAALVHGNPFHQYSFRIFGWEIFGGADENKLNFWWLLIQRPLKLLGHWLGGLGLRAWQTLWPIGALGWWGLWRNRGRLDELDENQLAVTALGGGVLVLASGFNPHTSGVAEAALAALGPALAIAGAGLWFRKRNWLIPAATLLLVLVKLGYPELEDRIGAAVERREINEVVFELAEQVDADTPEEVASTTWLLYDPDSPRLVPALSPAEELALDPTLGYARPWAPDRAEELISFARATGAEVVVFSAEQTPPKLIPGLLLLRRVAGMSVYTIIPPFDPAGPEGAARIP